MKLNIIIVEDETAATERLLRMLKEVKASINILAILDSVEDVLEWLGNNSHPDLAFFDIHLSDGTSLEVFETIDIDFPVVFTSGHDEYALDAFKTLSIDYLLKPYTIERLEQAFEKYVNFQKVLTSRQSPLPRIGQAPLKREYQQRFIIRLPEQIKTVEIKDIAYFYIESRLTLIQLKDGKSFPSDYNLEQLEERLNPREFFRVNRQFLVSYEGIRKMFTYTKSRIILKLKPETQSEVIVSSEKSAEFKHWLQG